MQVKNMRPWAVEIAHPDFFADVNAGGVVEVPDEVGVSLLEQPDNWCAVTTAKDKPAVSGEED